MVGIREYFGENGGFATTQKKAGEKGGAVNGIRPGLQRPEMPTAQGVLGLRAPTKYGAVFGALVPCTVP